MASRMNNHICPSCREIAFSAWGKSGLAPLKPKPCQVCGSVLRPAFIPFSLFLVTSVLFSTFCGMGLSNIALKLGVTSIWFVLSLFILGAIMSVPLLMAVNYYCVPTRKVDAHNNTP